MLEKKSQVNSKASSPFPAPASNSQSLNEQAPSRNKLFTLLLLFAVLWFGTLDYRALIKSDEGRYAEIAREMVASGDWVTPRYNGIKYFEKPPLQYWATATAFSVFGQNEWTARLWVGLTSFATVLMLFFTSRRLFGVRPALLGAIALASMIMPAMASHFNTLDMGVASFMSAALFALLLAQREGATPSQERNWMLCCWAAMALALLSKGLIGVVLPSAVLFLYLCWTRDLARLRRLHIGKGLVVFLLICVPWFALVMRANPEFFQFFFIHEHFERFLTKVHARYQSPWFFVPLLLAGMLPWTLYLYASLKESLHDPWRRMLFSTVRPNGHLILKPFRPRLLAGLWVVFIFAFFSASSSKLIGYIVPIFPALAMLLGLALANTSERLWRANLLLTLTLAIAGWIAAFWVPEFAGVTEVAAALARYQVWLQAGCSMLIASCVFALVKSRLPSYGSALALGLGGYLLTQAAMLGHESMRDVGASSYGLARALADKQSSFAPDGKYQLFLVDDFDHTLLFYLKRTAIMVKDQDEHSFGIPHSPGRYLPTIEAFAERWKSEPAAALVTYHQTFKELQAMGLDMQVVASDTLRVAAVKPRVNATIELTK